MNLFELQGDLRYVTLFVLALAPLVLAFQKVRGRRGWALVTIGNLLIFLTLILPASAASQLLSGAENLFETGTRVSNPRIFTSASIAFGLLGGYVITFGGLRDLVAEGVAIWLRTLAGLSGVLFAVLALLNGSLDVYSILVEFSQRGATLGQRFTEHVVFVVVSLLAGLVIGIALGLWAARDERMESIILYIVGIIQTIPSLALFGVLLVPLARLGDQSLEAVARFFVFSLIIGLIVLFVASRAQSALPQRFRPITVIITMLTLFVPISLLTIIVISFGFEAVLNVFIQPALSQWLMIVFAGFALAAALVWANRRVDNLRTQRWLVYARYGLVLLSGAGLLILIVNSAFTIIGSRPLSSITIRALGVSGIGTAPAIIALTLYSLLPLVRNTYAGLKNVDPAIIDSGRGMGMTPAQIFFQIELPLAIPVIMAGVRNAGISLVGIAAVASIIGAGALGDFILLGVNTTSVDLILLGAIPAIILAVILDTTMQLLEGLLTSPGIRQQAQ